MRFALAVLTIVAPLLAQTVDTTLTGGPPRTAFTAVLDYDGSNNLIYAGVAQTPAPYQHRFSVATCSGSYCTQMTNIVDSSNTGTVTAASHGLRVGNEVCVTGGSDTDLNACYIVQTVADANTFTITTASVTDATYTTGLVLTTRAPRTTAALWTITKLTYDGSNNLTAKLVSPANQIWANRAVSTGTTKIIYQ